MGRVARFPPVELADDNGLLCAGGDLRVETLTLAYRSGIFPWPHPPYRPILWFAPPRRAILEFKDFRLSRRDRQYLKNAGFRFTVNRNFEGVIRSCAKTPRPGQPGTWLTEEMIRAYGDLHRAGQAMSFEAWREGTLAGGLYGVSIGRYFSAESMFHAADHASKFALANAVDYWRARELRWMDIQVMTPHMERMGARLVPRREFMERLREGIG